LLRTGEQLFICFTPNGISIGSINTPERKARAQLLFPFIHSINGAIRLPFIDANKEVLGTLSRGIKIE
jgi:hypothetical protein